MTLTGPTTGRPRTKDALDVVVHDPELESEIRLLMDLIVAVGTASDHLDQETIDDILLSPSDVATRG